MLLSINYAYRKHHSHQPARSPNITPRQCAHNIDGVQNKKPRFKQDGAGLGVDFNLDWAVYHFCARINHTKNKIPAYLKIVNREVIWKVLSLSNTNNIQQFQQLYNIQASSKSCPTLFTLHHPAILTFDAWSLGRAHAARGQS